MESRQWLHLIGKGVGYVITRGGVIAIGAGGLYLGYSWGWGAGNETGFIAGCRATTATAGCVYADDAGKQIKRLKRQDEWNGLWRSIGVAGTNNQGKIEVYCDDLRDRLSRQVAAYYGCDE